MKRYITILFLLFGGMCFSQTVHSVKVVVGQGDNCPVVTGIIPVSSIQVFPNPATSTISIQSAIENASFRILNIQGKVMRTHQLFSKKEVVDISEMPEGVYILQISNDQVMQTMKIIVQ